MIGPGCSVILDERQYPILVSYLERIAAIGEINFVLEQCIDHRPGYSVSWDNDGSREQDDEVDRLMAELVQSLGFVADSIKRLGFVSDADDILADGDPDPTPEALRSSISRYAHVHGCSAEWIAQQLKLDLDFVVEEIRASSLPDGT
jgi:hypothetical protein